MGASISKLFTRRTTTLSIWRAPAASGNKVGAFAQVTASATFKLWPATTINMPGLVQALGDLAGARISHLGGCLDSVDVQTGDELRSSSTGTRYKVVRAGTWNEATGLALEEVTPRP
jgi:hypothetical protein